MKLFTDYRVLCDIPARNAELLPERKSHQFRIGKESASKTFAQFYQDIQDLSVGFRAAGVEKGCHIAFFSDNRYEWALTDYALMSIGAISVPRGSDTTPKEQKFIFLHSDSRILIMENSKYLSSMLKEFELSETATIDKVFLMDASDLDACDLPEGIRHKIVFYSDVLTKGRETLKACPGEYADLLKLVEPSDLATIIYTSGTSGNPKGVMLTHSNFLQNVRALSPRLQVNLDDEETTVSILPSWHVYERTFEYCAGASAMRIVYSNIKNMTEDLIKETPTLVCSVPRVWESFYDKITSKIEKQSALKQMMFRFFLSVSRAHLNAANTVKGFVMNLTKGNAFTRALGKALNRTVLFLLSPLYGLSRVVFKPIQAIMGGKLRAAFSGGGSLPHYVDTFFNAAGIKLVNAYGMTETSPGTITRTIDRNTIGSIGVALDETEIKILNDHGEIAAPGEKGIIYVRGPQVMKGYYKNSEATEAILTPDGWLNTGDMGVQSINGDFSITGRAKSTIVLIGGENIEPEPIEDKLKESIFIEHAVVLGQNKKGLVALIAVNEEKIKHLFERWKLSWDEIYAQGEQIIMHNKLFIEIKNEISRLINHDTGFRKFEYITNFVIVKKQFSVGEELTQTLKVKRNYLEEKYKQLIEKIWK